MQTLILSLIGLGFLSILLEEITHINKAKTTIFFGSLVWLLYFIDQSKSHGEIEAAFDEALLEIASLWLFLVATMTFVAYLNQRQVIAALVSRMLPAELKLRTLLFVLAHFAFVFSSIADNVTSTLVCLGLLIPLSLEQKVLLRCAVVVVFSVNAGGVALITGDVTTLMVFMAGKVDISHLLRLILPAYISVIVLVTLIAAPLKHSIRIAPQSYQLRRSDYLALALFMCCIIAVLGLNIAYGVPPLLSFFVGLALLLMLIEWMHHEEDMMRNIRLIEFDALFFFLGVLLMVGMLKQLGTLNYAVTLYDLMPASAANYLLGVASALIDNVPLTAALLHAEISLKTIDWISLVYAVGAGGSLLAIGSAAGVVAMSRIPALGFWAYLRFFPVILAAYSVGYGLSVLIARF